MVSNGWDSAMQFYWPRDVFWGHSLGCIFLTSELGWKVQEGLSYVPGAFAPLRVASPCGYLGLSHSMWAQVKLQFLHTLLVYNERGSSYQLLWRPGPETLRRLLFPNSVSQGKLKDGRNQIERKDSPRLDVRNICKYKEEKNLWEPNLETRYHKQWTENCGWKMPIEFRDILNKIHVLSVSL